MTETPALEVLTRGTLDVTGRLVQASNATFFAEAEFDGSKVSCVYKPIRGERPLWDFPSGSLAGREVAAYTVSVEGGFDIVPPTVLADGPFGPGMVQAWIDEAEQGQVDLVAEGEVPAGWRRVLDAFDTQDNPVTLIHADVTALRRMALFDVVVNNADRKGGHVLTSTTGEVYGCDHGVSFHVDDKLRTVLWGWAGEPITAEEQALLSKAGDALRQESAAEGLLALISAEEYACTLERLDDLIDAAAFPEPGEHWPSIPWPAF